MIDYKYQLKYVLSISIILRHMLFYPTVFLSERDLSFVCFVVRRGFLRREQCGGTLSTAESPANHCIILNEIQKGATL